MGKTSTLRKHALTRGRLIVLEGADGSGKGTQARLLLRKLLAEGFAAERIAFPQYDKSFFGRMVAAYLRGEFGPAPAVDPRLASLLYAADRFEARERIIRWLNEGKTVVCDRYVDSNKAHQALKLRNARRRAAFLKWVDRMEYGIFGMPKADCTVFLHVPHSVSERLIASKGRRAYLRGGDRDAHEADPSHLRRAERIYLGMASRRGVGRMVLIECFEKGCLLSRPAIAERVWKVVQPRLRGERKRG